MSDALEAIYDLRDRVRALIRCVQAGVSADRPPVAVSGEEIVATLDAAADEIARLRGMLEWGDKGA